MYWWDYGASPPWYGMFLGPLMMIVFLVVAALIIAWIVRASGAGWQSSWRRKSSSRNALLAARSIARNMRSAGSSCPARDESPFCRTSARMRKCGPQPVASSRRGAMTNCDGMCSGDGSADATTPRGTCLRRAAPSYGALGRLNMWIFVFHVPSLCFSKILTVWPAVKVFSPVSRTSWTVALAT